MRKICLVLLLFFFSFLGFTEGKVRWYQTQIDSGYDGNCGPASVAMAVSWFRDKIVEVQIVRDIIGIPYKDGAVGIPHLIEALKALRVRHERKFIRNIQEIDEALDNGSIVIILYNPRFIPKAENEDALIGRGYSYLIDGGHYSVIYDRYEDYFVVNDPYIDGEGRLYKKEAVTNSLLTLDSIIVKRKEDWR
tara:strand:- start:6409 stop:6984 length:576 start_codon:yes stop_codon:yes gene_type:complete